MEKYKRLWNRIMTAIFGPNIIVTAVHTKADGTVQKHLLSEGRLRFRIRKV